MLFSISEMGCLYLVHIWVRFLILENGYINDANHVAQCTSSVGFYGIYLSSLDNKSLGTLTLSGSLGLSE